MNHVSLLDNLPALVVATPLLSGVLVYMIGWRYRRLAQPLALLALSLTWMGAAMLFSQVTHAPERPLHYWLGGWSPVPDLPAGAGTTLAPIGIGYVVDSLNAMVALIVALIALMAIAFAGRPIAGHFGEKEPHYHALALLFVAGMMGMTLTGDVFNLYVLIEIASITAYTLVAMGKGAAPVAAFNYVLMGTVGACFYLLGVGYLYMVTGSLNMADIRMLLAAAGDDRAVMTTAATAFAFIVVGLGLKMALFPLHWWMPNAYSCCPNATSVLLAPLFSKVTIYVLIRMVISVFPLAMFTESGLASLLVSMAALGIVFGMVMALRQSELKRAIAYFLVAEMCYFTAGLGLANESGFNAATYHIVADALTMFALFAAAGAVAFRRRDYSIAGLRGLFKRMPLTAVVLVIGLLSVVGLPPTAGFFTKWLLIEGALAAGRYDLIAALLMGSMIAAVVVFRIFEATRGWKGDDEHGDEFVRDEAPISMVWPMLLAAAGIIGVGMSSGILIAVLEVINPFAR